MQAGVDVVVSLYQGFQADFTRTAHQRVIHPNIKLDIALACLVMPLFVFEVDIGNPAFRFKAFTIIRAFYRLPGIAGIDIKFIGWCLPIEWVRGMIFRYVIFSWHTICLPLNILVFIFIFHIIILAYVTSW